MRIVSGLYRGRRIEAPKGRMVRPTTDKVRGAIFNVLQSQGLIDGAVCIDIFCGTGGMGLEALSRGARFCTFVDSARDSLAVTRSNIESLGTEEQSRVIAADALKLAARTDVLPPADLAFLDPPYERGLLFPALARLHSGGWLAEGAMIVCEAEKRYGGAFPDFLILEDDRAYGEVRVFFLRYASAAVM